MRDSMTVAISVAALAGAGCKGTAVPESDGAHPLTYAKALPLDDNRYLVDQPPSRCIAAQETDQLVNCSDYPESIDFYAWEAMHACAPIIMVRVAEFSSKAIEDVWSDGTSFDVMLVEATFVIEEVFFAPPSLADTLTNLSVSQKFRLSAVPFDSRWLTERTDLALRGGRSGGGELTVQSRAA